MYAKFCENMRNISNDKKSVDLIPRDVWNKYIGWCATEDDRTVSGILILWDDREPYAVCADSLQSIRMTVVWKIYRPAFLLPPKYIIYLYESNTIVKTVYINNSKKRYSKQMISLWGPASTHANSMFSQFTIEQFPPIKINGYFSAYKLVS